MVGVGAGLGDPNPSLIPLSVFRKTPEAPHMEALTLPRKYLTNTWMSRKESGKPAFRF